MNVDQQARASWAAIGAAFTSGTDQRCANQLDVAIKDASCKAHWDADSATLAKESGAWNAALLDHRVPAKDLDLAHAFKDDLLELAHTFDDFSISAIYGDAGSYATAVGDIQTIQRALIDLKNQALAAGIDLRGVPAGVGSRTQ